MAYYKAIVGQFIEYLELCEETGRYIGVDPDTYQDFGTVRQITASSLKELKEKIERDYGTIEHDIENMYTYSCEGEYLYSTPIEEQIPFIETYDFYIVKVVETEITLDGKETE